MLSHLTKTILLITTIVPFVTYSTTFEDIQSKSVRDSLNNLWGEQRENEVEKTISYTPRLIGYTLHRIILSKTIQRFANLGKSIWTFGQAVKEDRYSLYEKSGYQFADGPLNIFGLTNDLISDSALLLKTPYHAIGFSTPRIKLCTTNLISNLTNDLTPIHFFNPAYHVGLILDTNYYETTDSLAGTYELRSKNAYEGVSCSDAVILNNEPVSIAIERTICIDTKLSFHYDFFNYNCGGYTRDVVDLAGLGYPGMPNGGIGAEIGIIDNYEEYVARKSEAKNYCDSHIKKVRDAIERLESGESFDPHASYFRDYYRFGGNPSISMDLIVQLYVSAIRGGNEQNKEIIHHIFGKYLTETLNNYFDENDDIRPEFGAELLTLYSNISKENLERLESYSPRFRDLIIGIKKLKKENERRELRERVERPNRF